MPPLPDLRLYNTLTRSKEVFSPIDAANVRMYVCGPTVYDFAHIGNARPLIVFDVLFRLLRHRYGAEHVTYVRNITDVDDKINARAAERGIPIRELTDETNRIFQEDAAALGCLPPTHQPRATDFVDAPAQSIDMIRMIGRLIETGHAYAADGHVLFSVPSMANYGKLSRRPLDEMIAGARVDVAPYKRGDMDFVLWKPSRENEPGWDSPWGRGRPGWHIECSAMAGALLGPSFDIHGGGIDLVFPHHENEIAQTCCAYDEKRMANVWMHNGFLQVEGEKMSKSAGNFVTISELLHTDKFGGRKWPGEVLRLAMLKTHYRQPIDWTVKALEEAFSTCVEWFVSAYGAPQGARIPDGVVDSLQNDLNAHAAFTAMHELSRHAARGDASAASQLRACLDLLGISLNPVHFEGFLILTRVVTQDSTDELPSVVEAIRRRRRDHLSLINRSELEIDSLITARFAARAAKNWAESDRIRDELAAMGIALKDNKDGTTTWEVAR